jgi:outer membrane lipoprotein-sorting protein
LIGKRGAARAVLCVLTLFVCARSLPAQQNHSRWSKAELLRQLDAAAKSFRSLSAEVERTKVTVVVNDKSTESGSILVRGDKMLLEMTAPDARTVLRNGDNLYVYNPGLKRVEEYNLARHRALADQFLRLGFGTSGKELERGYLVTVIGEEPLADARTVELELTPRSDEARSQFSKIQIWFDESSWVPLQQELFETGSGDYTIIKYARIVRNASIPESRFKPHWPKGTVQIKPQGGQ